LVPDPCDPDGDIILHTPGAVLISETIGCVPGVGGGGPLIGSRVEGLKAIKFRNGSVEIPGTICKPYIRYEIAVVTDYIQCHEAVEIAAETCIQAIKLIFPTILSQKTKQ
ncbi:uncharacterized protein N7525_009341, partial [Penicillium rubens]|uniref:uncharacterized protein n=1 Tax=Penicillium rubens TaxID=1108849 RepID=UPI002A598329